MARRTGRRTLPERLFLFFENKIAARTFGRQTRTARHKSRSPQGKPLHTHERTRRQQRKTRARPTTEASKYIEQSAAKASGAPRYINFFFLSRTFISRRALSVMPILRSDAYAFPVELPAALCGAAEASTAAAARRKEQHPEPTQLLSRSLATGRAACHCATPEERIYFGGAPPACPSEHRRVLQLRRKPRAAFPARRVRHKETTTTHRTRPRSRRTPLGLSGYARKTSCRPRGKPGARRHGKRRRIRRRSVPT